MDKEIIELIKIQQKFNDEFKLETKERISSFEEESNRIIAKVEEESNKRIAKVEDSIERIENNHLKHMEKDLNTLTNFTNYLIPILTTIFGTIGILIAILKH